jgi:excisionase family DNA binding protein
MNDQPHPVSKLYKAREAAQILSISERCLWGLTSQGKIPCVRIGRSVRYDPSDLRTWIEAQKSTSPILDKTSSTH